MSMSPARNSASAMSRRWNPWLVRHPFDRPARRGPAPSGRWPAARSGRPHDELAEQRVVEQRDLVTGLDSAVPAHPGPARHAQVLDSAGGRQEAVRRILAGDPALHRPAARLQPAIGHPHALARGDAELLPHQIHAVDQLGDGVLHLDPGVHLEEVERPVRRQQKLAGSRAQVAHRLRRRDRRRAHPLAELGCNRGRRGLFHQLLMPAAGSSTRARPGARCAPGRRAPGSPRGAAAG